MTKSNEQLIPKTIHYCWFGRRPLPLTAKLCIASWQKFLPDYEIKEWNESNFDVYVIPYTYEAYNLKKWAFVSDYARLWILYQCGGVYFDTDVEIVHKMDDILAKGAYVGCEYAQDSQILVALGLGLAFPPKHPLIRTLMAEYENRHFINEHYGICQDNICQIVTEKMLGYGFCPSKDVQRIENIWIYPPAFFCPHIIDKNNRLIQIEESTRTVHWYDGSWTRTETTIESKFWHWLGVTDQHVLSRIKNKMVKDSYPLVRLFASWFR